MGIYFGKMSSIELAQFQTKPNGYIIDIFGNIFDLYLPTQNSKGINWGLCSSEEEMKMTVVHFLI